MENPIFEPRFSCLWKCPWARRDELQGFDPEADPDLGRPCWEISCSCLVFKACVDSMSFPCAHIFNASRKYPRFKVNLCFLWLCNISGLSPQRSRILWLIQWWCKVCGNGRLFFKSQTNRRASNPDHWHEWRGLPQIHFALWTLDAEDWPLKIHQKNRLFWNHSLDWGKDHGLAASWGKETPSLIILPLKSVTLTFVILWFSNEGVWRESSMRW